MAFYCGSKGKGDFDFAMAVALRITIITPTAALSPLALANPPFIKQTKKQTTSKPVLAIPTFLAVMKRQDKRRRWPL